MSEGWWALIIFGGLFVVLPATLYLIGFLREASWASRSHRRLYAYVLFASVWPTAALFVLRLVLLYLLFRVSPVDDARAAVLFSLWTFIPEVVWLAYRFLYIHGEFAMHTAGAWSQLRHLYVRSFPKWILRTELIIGALVILSFVASVVIHGNDLNYTVGEDDARIWTNAAAIVVASASALLLTHFFPPREPIGDHAIERDPRMAPPRPGAIPSKHQVADRLRHRRTP